jgi:hypothetical protein
VRAEAAADFASFEAVLLFRILAADEATLALVRSVDPFWVSAEAATDFSAFVTDLVFRTFAADEATPLPVLALFAMGSIPCVRLPAAGAGAGSPLIRVQIEGIRCRGEWLYGTMPNLSGQCASVSSPRNVPAHGRRRILVFRIATGAAALTGGG